MSRKPKEDKTEWSLNVQNVSMDLFWPLHEAAGHAHKQFGEWVLEVVTKAAEKELKRKIPKRGRVKTSPASRASADHER